MENTKAKELFQEQFKFKLNEPVRHKADFKQGLYSDMGLLIIQRRLEESADDDGNVNFNRVYICRMIKNSGSGDITGFKESELLSVDEYNKQSLLEEQEMKEMKYDIDAVTQEIFSSFGVKRGTAVYIKNGDVIDKSVVYKVTGFSRSEKESTLLHLRTVAGEGKKNGEYKAKSKDEFVLLSVADTDNTEK